MVTRSPVNPVQKSYESVPSVKHLSRTDTELTSPRKEVTANCYDCFFGFVFLCMRVRISLFVCIIYLISPVSETVGSSMFNLSVLIPSIVNKLFCFSRFNLILKIFIIIHHTWLIAHDIIGLHDNMGNVYILKFIHGAFSPLFLKKSQCSYQCIQNQNEPVYSKLTTLELSLFVGDQFSWLAHEFTSPGTYLHVQSFVSYSLKSSQLFINEITSPWARKFLPTHKPIDPRK